MLNYRSIIIQNLLFNNKNKDIKNTSMGGENAISKKSVLVGDNSFPLDKQ